MKETIPLDAALAPPMEHPDDATIQVAEDIAYKRLAIVNVAFIGLPQTPGWVLVDAAVPGTAGMIAHAARERFGETTRPSAIVLTHGHFDHVGALVSLAEQWDVPIYAHELEIPYLDGSASYPPPDPSVGGGMMAAMSGIFPRGPMDVRRWLQVLPADGSVPPLPGWRWLHTPGHTPGHVSLWREADRALIAGDAFVTTRQESAYGAITQAAEMHGPPMYYTQDFDAARASVRRLARLEPELAVSGHGRAMHGQAMRDALRKLAEDFDEVSRPERGRYTQEPARADSGTAYRAP